MKCACVLRGVLTSGRGIWAGFARRSRWAALGSDERGSVAIIFGLSIFVLFAMVGLAVDYARFVNARTQTIAATDAAVLAGARALQSNGGNQSAAIQVAQTYYQQGVRNRISVVPGSDNITFVVTDNGTAMATTGNALIATPFMHLAFGIAGTQATTLPLLRSNGSDYSKAVLAVGGNGQTSLEVSMMLDITGSMGGQKLTDMKSAASDLVNIVIWQDQSKYTSKIAIVPFAYDVMPPSSVLAKLRGSSLANNQTISGTKYYLTDCVVERTGSEKYSDAAPAANAYLMGRYTTTTTGSGSNKKGKCDVPAAAELLPLTSDKSALLSKISGLSTAGSTAGHLGTAWAWYLLSPNWGSLWTDAASRPAAYGTDKLKKIAVLMTDGEYNTVYSPSGTQINVSVSGLTETCTGSANTDCTSAQARALCQGMKDKGIEVYTVGFQLGGSKIAIDTLSKCATDANHFYNSSTGDALKAAFRDIALKISTLYLSQ